MKIVDAPLEGLKLIHLDLFKDERGFFSETYQLERYRSLGITDNFVQDNHSRSRKGVLRGLHYQVKKPQAQIVTLLTGSVCDVVVDLRPQSSTFGQSYQIELTESGIRQVYMAPGFAHGFCALSDTVDLYYKVSGFYNHNDEAGLYWADPVLNIKWPDGEHVISARDAAFPKLKDITHERLPHI